MKKKEKKTLIAISNVTSSSSPVEIYKNTLILII